MKNLDLINENLNYSHYMKECHNKKTNIILTPKQVEQIKQSLEVLEIIRKKDVDIGRLKMNINLVSLGIFKIEEALDSYNLSEEYELTLEELLKLKQWLEKEEN